MSETPRVGAFAIVPSNDLSVALRFWERLGFARTGGDTNYIIMTGWGCEVHLTQAGTGLWRVPEENNPFGIFIRSPEVDAIAARVDDLVIRPGGILRHREWGLYEVGICGPDGMLVRIGWPSRLIKSERATFARTQSIEMRSRTRVGGPSRTVPKGDECNRDVSSIAAHPILRNER